MISNLEYTKLKLSYFVVRLLNTGGSHLSHTAVKLDSCLAWIFFCQISLYN